MPLVSFHNITVKVPNVSGIKRHLPSFLLRNVPQKEILHNVSGTFPKKGLVAVMGPSGSSKTTLLNTISNRMSFAGSAGLQAFGEVHVDNVNVAPDFFFSKKVSFVPQETCLFAELTPRESITYATRLTYPHWSDKEVDKHTQGIITALNINKCADSQIGNEIFRGISGGEAKRTSIGVNIINQPEILILDEPTTGLDSETATIVVRSILNLSTPSLEQNNNGSDNDDGRLIIMTLHQPSSEIWEMIDHIVLLAEGHIVYNGPTKEAIPYFASLGFHLPSNTNPADFLLDVVQMAEDDFPLTTSQPGLLLPSSMLTTRKEASSTFLPSHGPYSRSNQTSNVIITPEENSIHLNNNRRSSTTSRKSVSKTNSTSTTTTSTSNTDKIKQLSLSHIGLINGKETIVRAPKHANKFERARYLAHAWKEYEEQNKCNNDIINGSSSQLQYTIPRGYTSATGSISATGSNTTIVVEDEATLIKRERLRQMMVQYHKTNGHLYCMSNSDSNKPGCIYDDDESQDTFNYEDDTNPLRFSTSNGNIQHGTMSYNDPNNINNGGIDFESNHNHNKSTSNATINNHEHNLSLMQVFFSQLFTLTSRSWTTFIRQKLMLPMKFGQVVLSALLVIALYYRFSHDQQSVLQRSSCMYLLIIVQIFATVLSVALTFPNERGVFVTEQASRLYMVIPYFLSKLIIDIPILTLTIALFSILTYFPVGFQLQLDRFIIYFITLEAVACIGHGLGLIVACLVPSPALAVLFAPMTIAPFILFSHIAIPNGYVIPILRPVMWLSPFYWGLDALMINEFRGIRLGCKDNELYAVPSIESGLLYLCRFETAKDALDSYSIKMNMMWPSIIVLYVIAGALIVASGISLQILASRISKAVKLKPATYTK